jgi:hypothetical protein
MPATSLILLAGALLLFGIGGGLVGYMVGERHGEARADAIVRVLGDQWEAHRGAAKSRFESAIGDVAARLEKAAADLKAEVSMYHGCGAICNVIAYQFGEELLHARDAVRKTELPALADWGDTLRQGGIPVDAASAPDQSGAAAAVQLVGRFPASALIAAITLLSTTVALCFGFACYTVLKLRITNAGSA